MTLIKIINGIYGYHINEAVVEPKTASDPAFYVDDKEAERLVELNVARIIEPDPEVAPVQPDDVAENDEAESGTEAFEESDKADFNESMKLDDLKKIAIDAGASKNKVKKMRTKKEVIAAIEAAQEKAAGKQEALPQVDAADFV